MRTDLCDRFGIDYPIFAFTPSEHVAAAVSRVRDDLVAFLIGCSFTFEAAS